MRAVKFIAMAETSKQECHPTSSTKETSWCTHQVPPDIPWRYTNSTQWHVISSSSSVPSRQGIILPHSCCVNSILKHCLSIRGHSCRLLSASEINSHRKFLQLGKENISRKSSTPSSMPCVIARPHSQEWQLLSQG